MLLKKNCEADFTVLTKQIIEITITNLLKTKNNIFFLR